MVTYEFYKTNDKFDIDQCLKDIKQIPINGCVATVKGQQKVSITFMDVLNPYEVEVLEKIVARHRFFAENSADSIAEKAKEPYLSPFSGEWK